MNRISIQSFPKQQVVDYIGVFRTLPNAWDGVFYKNS